MNLHPHRPKHNCTFFTQPHKSPKRGSYCHTCLCPPPQKYQSKHVVATGQIQRLIWEFDPFSFFPVKSLCHLSRGWILPPILEAAWVSSNDTRPVAIIKRVQSRRSTPCTSLLSDSSRPDSRAGTSVYLLGRDQVAASSVGALQVLTYS